MPTTATNTTSAIDVARSFFTSYNAHYLGRTWMRKRWMNSPIEGHGGGSRR
jgi:hypothetical protein